jgi:hypothetical protein
MGKKKKGRIRVLLFSWWSALHSYWLKNFGLKAGDVKGDFVAGLYPATKIPSKKPL